MPPNTSIEVKSAAYYQAWKQDKPSTIQFGIEPHGSYEEFIEEKKRWADIYVFCVFEGENALDCLDTNKWDFYVIATRVRSRSTSAKNDWFAFSYKTLSTQVQF